MAAQMLSKETTASHVLKTSQNLGFSLQGELFSGNGILLFLMWFISVACIVYLLIQVKYFSCSARLSHIMSFHCLNEICLHVYTH